MDTKMASKSLKVKINASSASERTEEDLRAIVTKLRVELDVERKTTRQLRREKAIEVQQVREQEQTKASIGLKDLAVKLHQEKQREIELQKDILRAKQDADVGKVVKQKDQEIKKVKQDLAKCQHELKEEVTKRGLSTSARGTFETERNKLLQELKEQSTSKKQLEDALRAATDAEKQKNHEIRMLQDNCKLELARVEKEANFEVKKLLEELKTKDSMLVMMDRNMYPDKSNLLKQQVENLSVQELLNLSREVEKMTKSSVESNSIKDACVVSGGCALQNIGLQKKLYELEKQLKFANGLHQAFVDKNNTTATINKQLEGKLTLLNEQITNLNCELSISKTEINRLNEALVSSTTASSSTSTERSSMSSSPELDTYKQQCEELQTALSAARLESHEKDRQISLLKQSQKKQSFKHQPKTVRFMLPDEDDDDQDRPCKSEYPEKSFEDDSPMSQFPFDLFGDEETQADTDEILIQNVHKDYEKLMTEHLSLEKYCATLVQAQPSVRQLEQQSWLLEKEAFNLAMWALEEKVRKFEEGDQLLKCQLQEVCEQNEEMEFRILELEECTEKNMSTYYEKGDVDLMEKNQRMESNIVFLKQKLSRYESMDINEVEKDAIMTNTRDVADIFGKKKLRLSIENLRKMTSNMSDSEDDNPMVTSFSTTTSGFDEISCMSLELDGKTDATEICHDTEMAREFPSGEGEPNDLEEPSSEDTVYEFSSGKLELLDESTTTPMIPKQTEVSEGMLFDAILCNENQNRCSDSQKKKGFIVEEGLPQVLKELDEMKRQLFLSTERERRMRDQFALFEEEKNQRIRALHSQVDMLEENEVRLSETIEALEDLERQIQPSFIETETHLLRQNADLHYVANEQFWIDGQQVIESNRTLTKQNAFDFDADARVFGCAFATETREMLDRCISMLCETEIVLDSERRLEKKFDQKICLLEQAQTTQFELQDLHTRFNELERLAAEEVLVGAEPAVQQTPEGAFGVKSLKIRALEVVAGNFKRDFEELRSYSKQFLTLNHVEKTTKPVIPKPLPIEHSERENKNAGIQLNTNLPWAEPPFDIRSPSSMHSDWTTGCVFDPMHYGLHQQIYDLERERDLLQELVYKDENTIAQLTLQKSELEQSEENLRGLVKRLETVEKQTRAKVDEMEEFCEQQLLKLKEHESNEESLQFQIDKYEATEAELANKLHSSVEELESRGKKSDEKIAALKGKNMDLKNQNQGLFDLVQGLERKETSLKQKVRSLETEETNLQQKVLELELGLNLAYVEIARVNAQKDSICTRFGTLDDENTECNIENLELKEENRRLVQDVDRFTSADGIHKDANRKMCLLLHENVDELQGCREQILKLLKCQESHFICNNINDDIHLSKPYSLEIRHGSDKGVQVSSDSIVSNILNHPVVVIQHATAGFRKALQFLGVKYPQIQAEFIASAIESSKSEEMKKFTSSVQIKCSANMSKPSYPLSSEVDNLNMKGQKSFIHADRMHWQSVEGEENLWATVEDPNDIYDLRVADQSVYWINLEKIMGVNPDSDMEMQVEFRDAVPESKQKIRDKENHPFNPPPLPMSPPPGTFQYYKPTSRRTSREDQNAESADEASEIQDEDDGAVNPRSGGTMSSCSPWLMLQQSDNKKGEQGARARSAGFTGSLRTEMTLSPVNHLQTRPVNLGLSLDSIADSGMDSLKMQSDKCLRQDETTQTDFKSTTMTPTKIDETNTILRIQLEQKDKNLIAQSNEVDRLSQEMRCWQEKAVSANEEVASLTALLSLAQDELQTLKGESSPLDDKNSSSSSSKFTKKTRLEPYVSQIPVSVRLTVVDHCRTVDARSPGVSSRSPRACDTSLTQLDSVPNSGSSLSKAFKFPSHLPRPIGDRSPPQQYSCNRHDASDVKCTELEASADCAMTKSPSNGEGSA